MAQSCQSGESAAEMLCPVDLLAPSRITSSLRRQGDSRNRRLGWVTGAANWILWVGHPHGRAGHGSYALGRFG